MSVETLLRDERPEPHPEFAAELDALAARRFAKPARERQTTRRRFRIGYVLAAATTLVIATVIAVGASGLLDGTEPPRQAADENAVTGSSRGEPDIAEERLEARQEGQEAKRARLGVAENEAPIGRGERKVARTADLTLSTAPADLRDVADAVVEVTHRYGGFVVASSVSSGGGPNAGGDFDLKLPARDLQPALDDLSELAHVSSLTEGTEDITNVFRSGRERIAELIERRERLRSKLAEADTIDEERSIRFRLGEVRAGLEAARAELMKVEERVRLVPVHVGIKADGAGPDAGWSIGDALDDAVRVLEVAVAVTLIALAAAVPIAIVAVLMWLAASAWVRRQREEALDERPGEMS